MIEHSVKSFVELHQALEVFQGNAMCIYRGQSDLRWDLVPKAGRAPFNRIEDDALLADWKSDAVQYLSKRPRTSLEWLALAQHHGLATRMLDWTRNPLVAAFFAVCAHSSADAVLYAYEFMELWARDLDVDLFRPDIEPGVIVWQPDVITPRLGRQQGLFTIHTPPTTVLRAEEGEKLMCIRIENSYCAVLRRELAYYGITRSSLFPDLDGLSAHHNWQIHEGLYIPLRQEFEPDTR